MSSISPFSSDAMYAASLTPAPAASSSKSGLISKQVPVDTPKDTVDINHTDAREIMQMGRVAYQQQAGKLTSAQATQIDSLISQLQTAVTSDKQANGGTLTSVQAQNITQMQNGISKEIYANAHDISNGSNQIVPPSTPAV